MSSQNTGLARYANTIAKTAPPEVLAQLREIRDRINSKAVVKRPPAVVSNNPWNHGVTPLKQA